MRPNVDSDLARHDVDSVDLLILEKMLEDATVTFRQIARITHTDQRTIAKRFERMVKLGIVRRVTVDVDWSKMGLTANAYMGSTTALGEDQRKQLFDFIKNESRVIEAYTTLGSHEYFMKVLDRDIATLRTEICTPLEPLTVLSTSIVVDEIKKPDFKGLLRYLHTPRKRKKGE